MMLFSKHAVILSLFVVAIFSLNYVGYGANTYLTAYIDKNEVQVGETIKVFGYVLEDDNKEGIDVSIFLNDQLIAKVPSDKKGYFEAYVQINEPGINIIKIIKDNVVKSFEIVAKQSSPKPTIVYSSEDYDVVIIVNDKKQVIWNIGSDNAVGQTSKTSKGYVDYFISTKEVDLERGKGAKLIITVYNHDSVPHIFKVNATLDEKDYYPSDTKEVLPGKEEKLVVFIKPLHPENLSNKEYYLNIYIDGKLVKKEPIQLNVLKKSDVNVFDKVEKTEWIALGIIAVGVLLLGVSFWIYKT